MTLPEDLLHFIWKYRLYHAQDMFTVSGQPLAVLDAGVHNRDAGADFQSAKLRIGATEWAGSIEIHWRSSDWNVHQHQWDHAYNNVVLHVVYEYDKSVSRQDGTTPETLELKPLIPVYILPKYREMMHGMSWIPCQNRIHTMPPFRLSQWLSRLLIERFELRMDAIFRLLEQQRGSWEDTCYIWMARSFGFNVNAPIFEQLARVLPQGIVAKYQQRPLAVEALFFGQAGMLEGIDATDEYTAALQKEYIYLRKLHALSPLVGAQWKFMRTRPANFPSMRIAQFAAFCLRSPHSFAALLDAAAHEELAFLFRKLPVNDYWLNHYRLGVRSGVHSIQLGKQSVDTLLINTVAVILFAYGKYINKEMYIYRAISLLERLKPEDNTIIRRFSALGIQAKQAADSQALLQMKAFYCDRKKCLDCGIGLEVIKHKEG